MFNMHPREETLVDPHNRNQLAPSCMISLQSCRFNSVDS